MRPNLFLLSMLLAVICCTLSAQDLIILKNGDEIKALVSEVDLDIVRYKRADNPTGPNYSLEKAKIFMIKYKNGTKDVFYQENVASSSAKVEVPVTTSSSSAVKEITPKQATPPSSVPSSTTQALAPKLSTPVEVKDVDGNTYTTVTIGKQVWMTENLKSTHYRNGDLIPNISDNAWSQTLSGAMCYYQNDTTNKARHGALYNWYAMTDPRGICPDGWHIPTENDWDELVAYLGGEEMAGGKMKQAGTMNWESPNTGGTNESGFTAFASGGRYDNGRFDLKGYYGLWGTSVENDTTRVWFRSISWDSSKFINQHEGSKRGAGSVRCIRDIPASSIVTAQSLASEPSAFGRTGGLKIFSELNDVSIFLDEKLMGKNITEINDIAAGSHYLKVLFQNIIVFGEVVAINEGATSTVLIKNSAEVQAKILNSKVKEQEEFRNNRLDIILSRGSSTTTKGYSNLFPGYYGYWGSSTSTASTVETTDWKIIQGGVKEINEASFANITNNTNLQASIAKEWKNYNSLVGTTAIIGLVTLLPSTLILIDMINTEPHKSLFDADQNGSVDGDEVDSQIGWFVGCALPCFLSMTICLNSKEPSGHNISVNEAAKEAQRYNAQLKVRLGLPEYYDVK